MAGKAIYTKALLAVLAALCTFGVLYGANMVLVSKTVDLPLLSALTHTDGVQEIDLCKQDDTHLITASLYAVVDLKKTYDELFDTASQVLGRRKFELCIADNRNSTLEAAYYNIHYDVQQAVFTGEFVEMAETVQHKLALSGVHDHRVVVGTHHVFVQMHDGQGHYLYEIVERPAFRIGELCSGLGRESLWRALC